MERADEITSTMQDYLKIMLIISEVTDEVRITDIADRLKISKASTAQTIEHLKTHGLVEQSRYGPVNLTSKGKEIATEVKWRHEKLKKFLIEVLGCEAEIAEQDACRIEHILSAESFAKIKDYVNQLRINS